MIADYPWYTSEAELVGAADVIVTGRTVDSQEGTWEEIPYTVLTVEVTGVAEGAVTVGDHIEVKVPAGKELPAALEEGNSGILFLATYPDAPASLVNPDQGVYLLDPSTGVITADPDNPIQLSDDLLSRLGLEG